MGTTSTNHDRLRAFAALLAERGVHESEIDKACVQLIWIALAEHPVEELADRVAPRRMRLVENEADRA